MSWQAQLSLTVLCCVSSLRSREGFETHGHPQLCEAPAGSPSLSQQRCWQSPEKAAEKAFTFRWEIAVWLTPRSKNTQEKDELAVQKLAGGDRQ